MFANSLDHSDIRYEIKNAMSNNDEVALAAAIDTARNLGFDYPYKSELEEAEEFLYDLFQGADNPMEQQNNDENY